MTIVETRSRDGLLTHRLSLEREPDGTLYLMSSIEGDDDPAPFEVIRIPQAAARAIGSALATAGGRS